MALTGATLDDILNVYFVVQSQTSNFYCGLVDNSGFTAFASGDTMSSHAGWAESTAYSNSTRIAWVPGTSSGGAGSITNGTAMSFTINATATIHGVFLSSVSTKGGTTGNLAGTAAFSGGNQSVNSGDTLKVTLTAAATTS